MDRQSGESVMSKVLEQSWLWRRVATFGVLIVAHALIVFAILLTRGGETPEKNLFSSTWLWGAVVTIAVFGTLAWAIKNSFASDRPAPPQVEATVKQIGDALMTKFVLPLEVIGLLLTAAMIGAVIIAMKEEKK